jgi:hypothetical protein
VKKEEKEGENIEVEDTKCIRRCNEGRGGGNTK